MIDCYPMVHMKYKVKSDIESGGISFKEGEIVESYDLYTFGCINSHLEIAIDVRQKSDRLFQGVSKFYLTPIK